MKLFRSIYIYLGISFALKATILEPIPFEEQLDGGENKIIHGKFNFSSYKRVGKKIVTEFSFTVENQVGSRVGEIFSTSDYRVSVPGGVWLDQVVYVPGVPKFKKGEEVILIIKRGKLGKTIANLSLGKYNVLKEDGVTYVQNSVYPKHPEFGKQRWESFQAKVANVYGSSLAAVKFNKVSPMKVAKSTRKVPSRGIASIPRRSSRSDDNERAPANEDNNSKDSSSLFWSAVLLGAMAFIKIKLFKKENRKS